MATKKSTKKKQSIKKITPEKKLEPKENKNNSIPPQMEKKLKAMKKKIDTYQKKILDKFENYIMGIALLPPQKKEGESKPQEKEIQLLILIDDSDSHKMPKHELKEKLSKIMLDIAEKTDKNLKPNTILLSEVWGSCFDAKYDLTQLISISAIIYDEGMMAAIKICEIHKTMVIKKFEKYIVSYVLAGSLVQGKATKTSDIDVWIVIDDTDVKKMTRAELKDKLRAIIIQMGMEAGEITGIKNKLNIQVYILTDFWDYLKEASPVVFTLLRDGIPFYDRGLFVPWKQLLKMGKIKPSREAIDMFMVSGDQMLQKVDKKIINIGMEDIFWAILTPSQAALMLYGVPPPTPKETPVIMKEIFVKKEKLLEESYVKILEKNIKVRKDIEHGLKKKLTGKEVDELLSDAKKYLKRITKLFKEIEEKKEKEDVIHIYDGVVTIARDVLRLEGIEKVDDTEILKIFEKELVNQGKIPEKFLRLLESIIKSKKKYDSGKLTKLESQKIRKKSTELIKFLVEYLQRKRGRELERTKIKVKHGNKYGEVIMLDKIAFIIHDIDQQEKDISKAKINPDGSLGIPKKSNLEELEKELVKVEIPSKTFIKEPIFENLKDFFGKDVESLINY